MTTAGVLAILIGPAMVGIPYLIDYLSGGKYSHAFIKYPNDDSVETELLVRMFIVGVIPTILYRKAFLLWPIVSWTAMGLLFVLYVQDIKGATFAFGISLPFLLIAYSGSAVSFVCQYAYERIRIRHDHWVEKDVRNASHPKCSAALHAMTTDEAVQFLQEHPRIPAEAPQAIIDRLDAVRQHLSEHADARCIPHVLGVFGDHMGWGIFQLFDGVLRHYTSEQLVPHLIAALLSEHRGTRWWAAHWAIEWPHVELLPALLRVLESPEDEDAHYFCLVALGDIYATTGDTGAIDYLRERAARETDPERRQLLDGLLNTTA